MASEGLDDRGSSVEVVTGDGQSARAEVALPLGDPDRPFDRADLVRKFAELVGAVDAEPSARWAEALFGGDMDGRPVAELVDHLPGRP